MPKRLPKDVQFLFFFFFPCVLPFLWWLGISNSEIAAVLGHDIMIFFMYVCVLGAWERIL